MKDLSVADKHRKWVKLLVRGTIPKAHEARTELEEIRVEFEGR